MWLSDEGRAGAALPWVYSMQGPDLHRHLAGAPAGYNGTYVPWYKDVDQYVFVECMLICAMVCIAVVFEKLFHALEGMLDPTLKR